MLLNYFVPDGNAVLDRGGKGKVGGHAVVDGKNLGLGVVRHEYALSRRGHTAKEDIAAAVYMHQQPVAVLLGNAFRLDAIDTDSGDRLLPSR